MKLFHASLNGPETVFHEMPWKKKFTVWEWEPFSSMSHNYQTSFASKGYLRISIVQRASYGKKGFFFIGRCSHPGVFCKKKVFLKISQNSQENTCARVSFLIKLQFGFIKKEALAQVFSCEFSEISKDNFFHRIPLVAASVFAIKNYVEWYSERNVWC